MNSVYEYYMIKLLLDTNLTSLYSSKCLPIIDTDIWVTSNEKAGFLYLYQSVLQEKVNSTENLLSERKETIF